MAFEDNTRLKFVKGTVITRPTGGGAVQIELPKTGILVGVLLPISATLSGTLTSPNALGLASVIRRVTLRVNAGHTLFDVSGAGYHYLLANQIQDNYQFNSYTDALSAVTTGTKVLDMFIPVSLQTRDQIGMFMLQNLGTFVTLTVDWEADATVATGATITGTASPVFMLAEVPTVREDQPNFDTIHQVVEEQQAISSSADVDHQIQIGSTLTGVYYLIPAGFTNYQLRLQDTNIVEDLNVAQYRMRHMLSMNRDSTVAGALSGTDKRILLDFGGTDGLGQFGSRRDFINTRELTKLVTRISPVGATTLYAVRRQLLKVG
jgi:hypothetical protein